MIDAPRKVCKITATVLKGLSGEIMDALADKGVYEFHLAAGRAVILDDRKGFFGLGAGTYLYGSPVEVFSFLVPAEAEEPALNFVMNKGELDIPGRGSIQSEQVTLLQGHDLCQEQKSAAFDKTEDSYRMDAEVLAICCIVQRGEGEVLARAALDIDICVPTITYGNGTGVRDKLGLLRITIPAEKDIVHLVANIHDAQDVMNLLIIRGKLDQPGKGFIYRYPLAQGYSNKKISRGAPRHTASIEQIISAIDEQRGTTIWRRRSGGILEEKTRRKYLLDLIDFTLICNEGQGGKLVKAAMAVGVAGATISKQKYISRGNGGKKEISPAREACNMIVGEQQIPVILEALEEAGAFGDAAHGQVVTRPAPQACTFLGG